MSVTTIDLVVGARPNFVKAAALLHAAENFGKLRFNLVHTDQHKDIMSDPYFKDLELPAPAELLYYEYNTYIPTVRFGYMIEALGRRWTEIRPDFVMVVGDTDSTAAGAIAAAKERIPVIHVEAGLRSQDPQMQEEVNRILVDSVAEIMYTTSRDASQNLLDEGKRPWSVKFVGNVMIDTLHRFQQKAAANFYPRFSGGAFLTLHRAENVDNEEKLEEILGAVNEVAKYIRVTCPLHPRVSIEKAKRLADHVRFVSPMGYLEFIANLMAAKFVMTDSGGVQEEATAFGVPCLTLRERTERPVTVFQGSNRIVGTNRERIIEAGLLEASGEWRRYEILPELWDGHAADRIMQDLSRLA